MESQQVSVAKLDELATDEMRCLKGVRGNQEGPKAGPKGAQGGSKGAHGGPREAQGDAKGAQGGPKGAPKEA